MASANSHHDFATLHQIMSGLQLRPGAHVSRGGRPMHGNLSPAPFPRGEGLKLLSPEQLLSVRVPHVRITNGRIEGYQGQFNPAKARAIGQWIIDNADEYLLVLPVVEISLEIVNGKIIAFATDGQHRISGGVIANRPIKANVTKRSTDQQRRLFALQGRAKKPSRNLMILDSDGVIEEYVQDAITSDTHPWSKLISATISGGGSKTRMSATAAYGMLQLFVLGRKADPSRHIGTNINQIEFDVEAADQLATLVSAFGNRQTNPLAYSSTSLRAIAVAARQVFRVRNSHADDERRWLRVMPTFKFSDYAYLKSSNDLANQLIAHWNRRLTGDRKAQKID